MSDRDEKTQESNLETLYYFPSPIYVAEKPEFLSQVQAVSDKRVQADNESFQLDDIYPLRMTKNYFSDPSISGFAEFVGKTAWDILSLQGYAMQDKVVKFLEMWTQQHYRGSSMEQHVHGFGSQIVGFYFLRAPENCSRLVFHDPRSAKVQIDLPEQDSTIATPASRMINFEPKPGMVIFSNSWLPHSFTRHVASEPIEFVHFNLAVDLASAPQQSLSDDSASSEAEVI